MATEDLRDIQTRTNRSVASWRNLAFLLFLWAAIYAAAVRTPPLLDDADATHSQAAQAMLRTHDFVILHVDGVPYLEKAPLPYWITALSLRCFGDGALAVHLPLALTVLGLALLAWQWSRRAWNELAGLLAGLAMLTSFGVFLFTRVFIPDALLSLLLALSLYLFLRAMDPDSRAPALHAYAAWATLAAAVMTKGLVALVFVGGAAVFYLLLTRDFTRLYRLRLGSGLLLFLVLAAPWHILAALRYPERPGHHGFLWFYFVNEHFLRYLGERQPRDYNKLPAAAYWLLHLVWLFPWSLFAPASLLLWWKERTAATDAREQQLSRLELARSNRSSAPSEPDFTRRTETILAVYSALVLVFFAFSTNQEYYTLPAYLPLLMLLTAPLSRLAESHTRGARSVAERWVTVGCVLFVLLGAAAAIVLGYALWSSRHAAATPDIGALMARRDVGGYTLSMSHFFDLTAGAFAALRLPAILAACAFAAGPLVALWLSLRSRHTSALLAVALTSSTILVAAHIAFVRFAPLLSSYDFAQRIHELEGSHQAEPTTQVLLFGDQAEGSSIPFYLGHEVLLVDGRSTSMLFGSTLPGAATVFLTHQELQRTWGTGERKILFVPDGERGHVDALHLSPRFLLMTESNKALYTDRPLSSASEAHTPLTTARSAADPQPSSQPVPRSTP